ncbi:MAG: hypothetical protein AAF495_05490 [Pseudomonadota bacterium]
MAPSNSKYDTGTDAGSSKVRPNPPAYVPEPNWQPFPGFSFLFDNPTGALSIKNGYGKIDVDVASSPALELYAAISRAVENIEPATLAQRFQFFALPSSTYHVTVWDGVNKGNLDSLHKEAREEFESCYSEGTKSLLPSWPPFGQSLDYRKWFEGIGDIRFEYSSLLSRDNTVLVVELKPADTFSVGVLDSIRVRRAELDAYFAKLGKPENYEYRAHVAVGYFANEESGKAGTLQYMDRWIKEFHEQVRGTKIEFTTIDLYAFTDMVTYVKPI